MEPPGGIFAFFKRSMSPASVPCVARFRLANPKQCKTILQIVSRAGDLQIPRERSLCCSLGVGKSPASVPCVARFGLANPKPCRTILQIVHGRGFANPPRAFPVLLAWGWQIPRERSLCCSLGVGKPEAVQNNFANCSRAGICKSPASVPCVARLGLANPKPCRTILQIVHGRGFANPLRAS